MVEESGRLPPQHQHHQPGSEAEMQPRPRSQGRHYRAAGKLHGKVAVISGGDSGIGRATAIAFAKEGADLAILLLEEAEDAAETRRAVEAEGRRCEVLFGDIGSAGFCRDAINRIVERFGRIDILVNNAAEQHVSEDFATIDEAQIERTFRTNVFGAMFLTRAALPHIPEGGAIVVTTSVTAFRGNPKLVDYSATKGALLALTRALAIQLAPKGIRVNAVAPGPVWTPLIPSSFSAEDVAKFGQSNLMGRPGEPDEIAPSFVFLASDDASFMTGQVLHPNGGEIVG